MGPHWVSFGFLLLGSLFALTLSAPDVSNITPVKYVGFTDPNTEYLYRVRSYNVTSMTAETTHRSFIKVSRVKLSEVGKNPIGASENVQTINFHPTLVDFDLHCLPSHCYLVAVTGRTKRNVELYSWQRTQFDLLAKRDSFARPTAVKLFRIHSGFYVAVAQEQLHLSPVKLAQEYEEPTRFIGCGVFKFIKGHEQNLKYHQFIRLPFNPLSVTYFTSTNSNNVTFNGLPPKLNENHYLVFSVEPKWHESSTIQPSSYIWSPLNDQFWPYRLPRGVTTIDSKQGSGYPILKFPSQLQPMNLTQVNPHDQIEPVETCFGQLQRLLTDRDLLARKLIDSSGSLWRSTGQSPQYDSLSHDRPLVDLTNITARVIVHGNVIVKGSLIESPQITLVGSKSPPEATMPTNQLSTLVNAHSPAIVEHELKQALYKLKYMRDKLARAIPANLPYGSISQMNSRISFFGNIRANQVVFKNNGVANSNVRLNGIPFKQLEHELMSLRGTQDIGGKVIFRGDVVADKLEILGFVNKAYLMKDAVDIDSKHVQVIEAVSSYGIPGMVTMDFKSVDTPELIMSHTSTINGVRLEEFITRDNRTQIVHGRKSFKHLSMVQLDLANSGSLLNGFNISRLALNSIRLRDPTGQQHHQIISGNHLTFSRPVRVDRLIINNSINRHINISSLIHDSVKTSDIAQQQISGHKHFLEGLKIAHLTTDGLINRVQINQVFNLNPIPPIPDYPRYFNSSYVPPQIPITGNFIFTAPATIGGNLNANLINGIDISKRAIRRTPQSTYDSPQSNLSVPQIVSGRKIFYRPLRVVDRVRLIDPKQLAGIMNFTQRIPYPLINGLDIRLVNDGIKRQFEKPSVIYIDNLEIEGNLNVPTSWNQTGPSRITFGNYSMCPLDVIRKKLVLAGGEEQFIDVPMRINSLRSRSIHLEPGALNGMNFPNDFVLRSAVNNIATPRGDQVEPVFGHKTFQHLSVSPSISMTANNNNGFDHRAFNGQKFDDYSRSRANQNIVFGPRSSINNITYNELQTFIAHERQRNTTGETIIQTLNVYGNINVKRINGYYWPDDILLKSIGSNLGPVAVPYVHKRIYSPLIFLNSSDLEVENQLVLRGPIQLGGRMNGVNLTEFARQSATYGDKDLLSIVRPIRNKVFLGGLTVTGQIRSQGLIDGVNIDEMRSRVVTIRPSGTRVHVMAPKVFMSDVNFLAPINVLYLNDLLLDQYLRRIQFQPGDYIQVFGNKTITGALKINKNLIVQGLINKIDFVDLKARAISLAPTSDEIKFNRTLTIEGDVFMDNLLIDENDGIIDGVKLTNLMPIDPYENSELVITEPVLSQQNATQGHQLSIQGLVNDCRITCSLSPPARQYNRTLPSARSIYPYLYQQPIPQPITSQPQPMVSFPRQIQYNGRNVSYTAPPYVIQTPVYPPLPPPPPPKPQQVAHRVVFPDQKVIQSLALRRPLAIQYERPIPVKKQMIVGASPVVKMQLDILRKQIVSLNLFKLSTSSDLVIGFIEAPSNDIGNLHLPEQDAPHSGHNAGPKSFLQLDQVDFPFSPTIYHLSVGVSTSYQGQNVTSVFSSVGGSELHQFSVLPIESPNSAMFLKIEDQQTLFLIISQDYKTFANRHGGAQCPRYSNSQSSGITEFNYGQTDAYQAMSGVHVYLFHALQNSSSLLSAYFDLYQTIDLPAIDSFEKFSYHGSTYLLAVSRLKNTVYLLLLRGYSGFQVVSYIDAPMVEYVRIVYTGELKPVLMIYQSNGLHRLMESVII